MTHPYRHADGSLYKKWGWKRSMQMLVIIYLHTCILCVIQNSYVHSKQIHLGGMNREFVCMMPAAIYSSTAGWWATAELHPWSCCCYWSWWIATAVTICQPTSSSLHIIPVYSSPLALAFLCQRCCVLFQITLYMISEAVCVCSNERGCMPCLRVGLWFDLVILAQT